MKFAKLWGICLALTPLFADRVLLKNGTFESGKIENETAEYVILQRQDETLRKIPRAEVVETIYSAGRQKPVEGMSRRNMPRTGLTLFDWLTLRHFTGAITLGWENLNLNDLNSALTQKGYKAAPENFFSIGGTAQVSVSRVVLGLDGAWLYGQSRDAQIGTNTMRQSFSALKMLGILGYLVHTSDHLDIFPFMGFGLAGYNLLLTNTQTDTFGNVLTTGQRGAVLSSLSLIVSPGVQLTYRLPILAADKGVFGLALGIKAGYDFAFLRGEWFAGGINELIPVTDGPKVNLTGPYAQVMVGIWFDFF
ncbi:MAG TPA: hypothetical protein PKG67_13935 [Turneriella sp.]|nr:hypothetical protein [Turneriella sp.]